jgi:hypothetical protein
MCQKLDRRRVASKRAPGENLSLGPSQSIRILVVLILIVAPRMARSAEAPPCAPFRVHRRAKLPPPPKIKIPKTLPAHWEENLAARIGQIKTQEDFPKLYSRYLLQNDPQPERERFAYLQCVLYYELQDTNHNGIPDWTAIIDLRPAKVLFAKDLDQDGDGVPNVLDPSPLDPLVRGKPLKPFEIPAHLRFEKSKRPETADLQQKIFEKFGILAIDHTDEHAAVVLRELLVLLEKGFSDQGIKPPRNFKYVYAFRGHDQVNDIAAFHVEAQALSIGGVGSYGESFLSEQSRADLLAALAHEIGHAFIFERFTAEELASIADEFGGWNLKLTGLSDSFFSSPLFEPHPLKWIASRIRRIPIKSTSFISGPLWTSENIVSEYATTNVHEWFADAFAAEILFHLGSTNNLGPRWRRLLVKLPSRHSSQYWVNYNNLSESFRSWISARLLK